MDNHLQDALSLFANPESKLKLKLQTALKTVNATCVFGAENKIDDEYRTNGWVLYAVNIRRSEGYFLKHKEATIADLKFNGRLDVPNETIEANIRDWYFHVDPTQLATAHTSVQLYFKTKFDPLLDPKFKLTQNQIDMLLVALLSQELRGGSCHLRANLIAKYLWEHPEGIKRIEVVKVSNFEHAFVIVNREGVLEKPETWGNAFIVDAWYGENNKGIFYTAAEFPSMIKKVKKFVEAQYNVLQAMGIESPVPITKGPANSVTVCKLLCEVKPQEQAYPTYSKSPFVPLEDYYGIDVYPKSQNRSKSFFRQELERDFMLHKAKMKTTLNKIKSLHQSSDEIKMGKRM